MSKESITLPKLTTGGVAEQSHGGVREISGLPKNEKEGQGLAGRHRVAKCEEEPPGVRPATSATL